MDAPVEKIQDKWDNAIAHPVEPVVVTDAACQEVVHTGQDLLGEGKGLGILPIFAGLLGLLLLLGSFAAAWAREGR